MVRLVIFFIEFFLMFVYVMVYFDQFVTESRKELWLQHAIAVISITLYVLSILGFGWLRADLPEIVITGILFISYIVLHETTSKDLAVSMFILSQLYASGALHKKLDKAKKKQASSS